MKRTVMVVDDSLFIYNEIKNMLKDSDYSVAAYCKNGETAIAEYDSLCPDIVTMDIIMEGIDGLDASEQIMKKHPDAKIVLVTVLEYDEVIMRARELGVKGMIFKPFDREQVLGTLDAALKSSRK